MSFLELTQLTKTYGKGAIRAVDELSLSIEQGEFVVLVGSSGCGKSTTLRLVAGLETPTSGSIRLDGRTITHAPPAERNVAMVFQDFALYPHMTVFDNIAFPLKARKVLKREREERVRATASMLDISDLLEAFGRTETASRHRPGDRAQSCIVPHGRTAFEPRRQAARPNARRAGKASR